jgi:AraC family transcriptional regulator, activator of mtrCDE
VDALSDVFDTVRLRGTLYFRTDYSAPWAIAVPRFAQSARFHLVVQGRCHVTLPSGQSIAISPGDLILIPRGQAHVLADDPTRTPTALDRVLTDSGYTGKGAFVVGKGQPGTSTQMVCGHFTFSEGADHPLLRALPDMIVMTASDRAQHPVLDDILRLVVRLAFSDAIGAAAVISRMSEAFFVEVLRASVKQSPELAGILEAMTDPQIGRALELIHGDPAKAWTVELLARETGMSRSRFAERFSQLMGEGPMHYIANWRLQRALVLLAQSKANIQGVANRIGYQSAASFTRAFTQRFGVKPSDYRSHPEQIMRSVPNDMP